MKSRQFKIRSHKIASQELLRSESRKNTEKADTIEENQQQFQGFFSIFKTFMEKMTSGKQNISSLNLEPRDREAFVDPPEIDNEIIEDKSLKRWTTSVFKTVFSTAFNAYSRNEMSFEQAKIYCSENIFKNLVSLNQRYSFSGKEFQMIDKHIDQGLLTYMGKKYPLTESTEANKKLQEILHEVDNIEALSNDYMTSTKVIFEYREDGNYNDLIMRFLNQINNLLDQETAEEQTNYHHFQEFMTSLFEQVMDDDWMGKNDLSSQIRLIHSSSLIDSPGKSNQEHQHVDLKETLKSKLEKKQKYRTTVKEYTQYLIGRKVPEHVSNYSEKEIKSHNLNIKSPTTLRILTKWCEELWRKYSQVGYYSNRSQSVTVQKGGMVNSLLSWMRKDLDSRLRSEKEEIVTFMKDISHNNYHMQASILKQEIDSEIGGDYLDEAQKISGKFSTKIVKNLHSYTIAYLNRLIHGLMKAAKGMHQENNLSTFSLWSSPPNLLSFRLGDLMRCKCSSKEKEILRLYKEMERLSRENPSKFKIVRIKNRLKQGTNDILMNVKFNDSILCEIQLAIKTRTSDFIKCSNLFHHYIYQLQRSNFGPLTELCSIWNALDRRADIYEDLIQEEHALLNKKDHICQKLNKRIDMVKIQKPFICSECNIAYFHSNYLRNHIKCSQCEFFVCSNCQILQRDPLKLKEDLIKDEKIRAHTLMRIDKDEPLPKLGLCIFLQSKKPRIQLFQHVNFQRNKHEYLFGRKNNKIYELEDIKTSKLRKQFRKRHLIFSVDDTAFSQLSPEEINEYILTDIIRNNFKKEKESISLMGQALTSEVCRTILEVGTKAQKDNVNNLFLTDNKLTELPFEPEEFPNLRWLTLSRNVFNSFDKFDRLKSLKDLNWTGGQMNKIPDSFYELVCLEKLALSTCEIAQISPKIGQLKNLRSLQLDLNKLQSLPEEISQCKQLVVIRLQGNELVDLPFSLFNLEKIEVLVLSSNYLSQLPQAVGNLKRLKQLNISNNYNIMSLPLSIGSLPDIQIFDCSNTSVSSFPFDISKWAKLKQLSFIGTSIAVLPENTKLLPKLEKLAASAVGSQLSQLRLLKNLNISNCNIQEIPSLQCIESLQVLDVSSNFLQKIEQTNLSLYLNSLIANGNNLSLFPNIGHLKHLQVLNVSNNNITEISNQSLEECRNLQTINLSINQLSYLPYNASQLPRLLTLDLSNNILSSIIQPQSQEELNSLDCPIWPKLTFINLNINQLEKLPKYLFNCSSLLNLFFSNNKLTEIPPDIGRLTKLVQLQANNNQIAHIPQEITRLPDLIGIYLSINLIQTVPEFISKINKLGAFYVDSCPISSIQCKDWINQHKDKMTFGTLGEMAGQSYEGATQQQAQPEVLLEGAEETEALQKQAKEPDDVDIELEPPNQTEGQLNNT